MFLKQYAYKPRSGSQGSQGATSPDLNAPKEGASAGTTSTVAAGATGPVSAAAAARRRSSAAGNEPFAGLQSHKRTSQDAGASARKASWAEQKPGQGGVLSGMWNNFTKGSS